MVCADAPLPQSRSLTIDATQPRYVVTAQRIRAALIGTAPDSAFVGQVPPSSVLALPPHDHTAFAGVTAPSLKHLGFPIDRFTPSIFHPRRVAVWHSMQPAVDRLATAGLKHLAFAIDVFAFLTSLIPSGVSEIDRSHLRTISHPFFLFTLTSDSCADALVPSHVAWDNVSSRERVADTGMTYVAESVGPNRIKNPVIMGKIMFSQGPLASLAKAPRTLVENPELLLGEDTSLLSHISWLLNQPQVRTKCCQNLQHSPISNRCCQNEVLPKFPIALSFTLT